MDKIQKEEKIMDCLVCKGAIEEKRVTHDVRVGDKLIVLKNVLPWYAISAVRPFFGRKSSITS